MTSFKISTVIQQPVEIIVNALLNPGNQPFWNMYLERFEVISHNPGEVGSVGRLHYLQNGRRYIMEDRLIYCEPGRKYVSRVSGDFLTATVETSLIPAGNSTEMTISWTGKGNVLFFRILLPLLRRKMIKQSKSELETFRKLVETRGSDFSVNENTMKIT